MSSVRASRHLPVVASIVVALMLSIMPLPGAAEPYRPDWLLLILIYWAIAVPGSYNVGSAWIAGLVLDVAQGTLLGQHALALTAVIYVVARFHLQLRVFPLMQLTATVLALVALYQFLLFWINGVAGFSAPAIQYLGPIVTGTIVWPIMSVALSNLRYRVQTGS